MRMMRQRAEEPLGYAFADAWEVARTLVADGALARLGAGETLPLCPTA
jgi:hypothetical protein